MCKGKAENASVMVKFSELMSSIGMVKFSEIM